MNDATAKTSTPVAFAVGQTYMTRSICDWNCKIEVTIKSRTRCFVTTSERNRADQRLRVSLWDGVEHVKPWGTYSMAPSVGADQAITF